MAASHLVAVPKAVSGAVPFAGDIRPSGEVASGVQRVRHLEEEARALAREQVELLAEDFGALAARSSEIAHSGDSYPPGIRELAGRLSDDLSVKVKVLRSIMDRTAHA